MIYTLNYASEVMEMKVKLKLTKRIKAAIVIPLIAISAFVVYDNIANPFTITKAGYYQSEFYKQIGVDYTKFKDSETYQILYKVAAKIDKEHQLPPVIDLPNNTVRSTMYECKFVVIPYTGTLLLTEDDEWKITSREGDKVIPNIYKQSIEEGFKQVRILPTKSLKIEDPNELHYAIKPEDIASFKLKA